METLRNTTGFFGPSLLSDITVVIQILFYLTLCFGVVAQLQGTLGKSQVNSHLKRAHRKGYLDNKTPGRGRAGHWVPDAPLPEKTLLPSPESVFDGGITGNRPEGRKVMAIQGESELPSGLPAHFRGSSHTSTTSPAEDDVYGV